MKTLEIIKRIREIIKHARKTDYRGDFEYSETQVFDEILAIIEENGWGDK